MANTTTDTEGKYKYFAFISYKREDEKWAKQLQNKLMHYKLPTHIRKQRPELPSVVHPVFRDSTDLSGGVLADVINEALDNSRYLIVICSPRAAQSPWVCKEADHFIKSGREREIIPFIIDGEPNSKDIATECFPEALRKLSGERELLGININENGRDAAVIKVVARMFNIQFDSLWQRYEREQLRRRFAIVVASLAVAIIAIIIGLVIHSNNIEISNKNIEIERKNKELTESNYKIQVNQARYVSEKAMQLTNNGDSYSAARLLLEIFPTDLNNPDKPLVDEMEASLRAATQYHEITYKGHKEALCATCCSPDGEMLVSASYDGTIKLWNNKDGKLLRTIETGCESVNHIALSKNGRYIAAALGDDLIFWTDFDQNMIIKIWDTKNPNNEPYKVFKGHTSQINFVAFDSNGKYLVSASDDFTVRLWDIENQTNIKTFTDHTSKVTSASFSPNDQYIVSSACDKTIKVWEVVGDNTYPIRTYLYDNGEEYLKIWYASFSPDGKKIISTADDSTIKIWNFENGSNEAEVIDNEHERYVMHASYSHDHKYFVSASGDGTSKVFNQYNYCLHTFGDKLYTVNYALFSHDDRYIIGAIGDGSIKKWLIQDDNYSYKACLSTFIRFSPDSNYFYYQSNKYINDDYINGNQIKIYKIEEANKPTEIFPNNNFKVIAFTNNSEYIITTTKGDSNINIWDTSNGTLIHTLTGHTGAINDIACSTNKEYIATASDDKSIKLWNTNNFQELRTLQGHVDKITSLSLSSNGSFLLSQSEDQTIKLWDTTTARCIKTIAKPKNSREHYAHFSTVDNFIVYTIEKETDDYSYEPITCIIDITNDKSIDIPNGYNIISPDIKYAIKSTEDFTIKVWDIENNQEKGSMKGNHNDNISHLEFSNDGKYIVSGSDDSTLKIWNVAINREILTLKGHDGWAWNATFSPNNRYILSSSYDETVKLWEFKPLDELLNETRERFKDNPLTPEERRDYYVE